MLSSLCIMELYFGVSYKHVKNIKREAKSWPCQAYDNNGSGLPTVNTLKTFKAYLPSDSSPQANCVILTKREGWMHYIAAAEKWCASGIGPVH